MPNIFRKISGTEGVVTTIIGWSKTHLEQFYLWFCLFLLSDGLRASVPDYAKPDDFICVGVEEAAAADLLRPVAVRVAVT